MLPQSAVEMLQFDIADAEAAAASGDAVEGYEVLVVGLRAAEAARAAGQPWGEELVREYREALHRYLTRYGLRP